MKFLSIGLLLSLIGFIKMVSPTDSPTASPTPSFSVDWNVKQCSYSNGKPYKQCNDLLGCQCSHNKTVNNGTCTQCVDGCALIRTKNECNTNMHCEFNSQCERVDLFSQTTVRFYHIEVEKEEWDFINSKDQWEDEPYVPCKFTMNYQQENEKSFEFAMVKVKGSVGSKVPCESFGGTNTMGCRSLSYQINIDRNLPDGFDGEEPKVGGKDKIQFHSMMNDNSLMIERLSYSIMHHYLKITTARAVHCVLFVNGEKLGIYLNVEEIDEKSIGPILFGEKGTMYKDAWPYDHGVFYENIFEEDMNLMEKLINESLQCVSEDRLTMHCSPEEGKAMLKKYIDTDSYTKAMLANNLLNNFDGTPKSTHNHYWFQNKNKGPYIFVPWDYNNIIMDMFCKVNKDTGIVEGFGDISNVGYSEILGGVCAAPPFQYLPSTLEERQLVCVCVPLFSSMPGAFNRHMTCNSAFGLIASQSLADDYFKIRDDIFKGRNETKVKSEVKSMVEYWSNQIRTHIDTSSLIYPPKSIWEVMIIKIPLFFDYGLDQLMNRKKKLEPGAIDAHFEWIKNRSKELGKCGDGYFCQSNFDCEYKGCEMEEMSWRGCSKEDGNCYVGNNATEECGEIMKYKLLEDGSYCFNKMKIKKCPGKKETSTGYGCQSDFDCEYKGCEMEGMSWRGCSKEDGNCYAGNNATEECGEIMEYKQLEDGSICFQTIKYKKCPEKKETSTAESKNGLFGIVTILILLSFIL